MNDTQTPDTYKMSRADKVALTVCLPPIGFLFIMGIGNFTMGMLARFDLLNKIDLLHPLFGA